MPIYLSMASFLLRWQSLVVTTNYVVYKGENNVLSGFLEKNFTGLCIRWFSLPFFKPPQVSPSRAETSHPYWALPKS